MGKFWDKLRRVQDKTRPFCTAIVPAAGSSTRMGGQDKLLADLCGTPVLMRTLCAIDKTELVDEIIVATGSVPRTMPMIPGFEKTLTFTELLKDKKEVGDKVLFIGGGQSSCEAAYDMLLNYGKHPIIVEYAGDLVAAQATCLANTSYLRDAMEYHKVPVYLHSTVTEITDKGCTVKNVQTGETTFVECDSVVNGIGFVPTPVGGKDNKKAYRVGDCVAIGNLRTVIWRAWAVCMKI